MGQFFSLHNCNVMHYNSKLVCNGNYISITVELHFAYGHFSAYISTNKKGSGYFAGPGKIVPRSYFAEPGKIAILDL